MEEGGSGRRETAVCASPRLASEVALNPYRTVVRVGLLVRSIHGVGTFPITDDR